MNLWNETRTVPISREMVWKAYLKVKANGKSAGVDEVSMDSFNADRSKHLYKLWNRMASGSYFPPAVRELEIPKKDGKVRKLGIPTISDRVGQMVVKDYLEPRFEKPWLTADWNSTPIRQRQSTVRIIGGGRKVKMSSSIFLATSSNPAPPVHGKQANCFWGLTVLLA